MRRRSNAGPMSGTTTGSAYICTNNCPGHSRSFSAHRLSDGSKTTPSVSVTIASNEKVRLGAFRERWHQKLLHREHHSVHTVWFARLDARPRGRFIITRIYYWRCFVLINLVEGGRLLERAEPLYQKTSALWKVSEIRQFIKTTAAIGRPGNARQFSPV